MKDKAVTHRLFEELKDRYLDRQGGYGRIIKKGTRKGDAAPISVIQLLPEDQGKKKSKKKGAAAKAGTGKSKDKTPAKVKKEETAPSKQEKTEKEETQ